MAKTAGLVIAVLVAFALLWAVGEYRYRTCVETQRTVYREDIDTGTFRYHSFEQAIGECSRLPFF